jgi:hypothetical protein
VLDFQQFPVLDVIYLLNVDGVTVEMGDPAFEAKDGLLEGDVECGAQVVALALEGGVCDLVELDVDVAGVEVEALLALPLEQHHVPILHPLLQLESQVARSDDDLVAAAG